MSIESLSPYINYCKSTATSHIISNFHRILAVFGYDDMYDIPLEVEAVEMKVQLERMKSMFGLTTRVKGGS